jgi:transcriptional regulator with PAS, ATPase and Fis domain
MTTLQNNLKLSNNENLKKQILELQNQLNNLLTIITDQPSVTTQQDQPSVTTQQDQPSVTTQQDPSNKLFNYLFEDNNELIKMVLNNKSNFYISKNINITFNS